MRNTARLLLASTITALPVAMASETIAYGNDAKGELAKVVSVGTVRDGVIRMDEHDKVDDCQRVVTTGSAH